MGELEYMLREFRKLERQLLGAKGAAQLEESAGSRERREKLHSFILHLEETVQQIEDGCIAEKEKQSEGDVSSEARAEEEENVQKLEEHILANLLPVKIRLKKQLAAQQGATRNPPGMPAPRRGSLQPTNMGKGTFAAAAEERRKQAEAARLAAQEKEHAAMRRVSDPTQFGKPLGGGGSSLTQKLHGATLGSKQRIHGHGVGTATAPQAPVEASPPKILYAGMVPQSSQHQSSLNAASGVHELVVEDPKFIERNPETDEGGNSQQVSAEPPAPAPTDPAPSTPAAPESQASDQDEKMKKPHEDISLSTEERKRLRKKRRKRKLMKLARRREKERQRQLALHQQAQAAQGAPKPAAGRKKSAASKAQGKKKGPKSAEYMCALCSEAYTSTCDYNPWWALAQHECPKCRKMQIPRIDISAPANAIEYHPALLAHADENNGGSSAVSSSANEPAPVAPPPPALAPPPHKDQAYVDGLDSDSESDLSELSDGSLSDDSLSDDDSLDFQTMSPAEQAEHETFGNEYRGPVLSDDHASRLLILMAHASTCPCRHKLTKHRDVCKSTKFMMLHVRDCPGTTATFDVCPFPWCRKVKHLLYHLVSCVDSDNCDICSPKNLSESLKNLDGLNSHRVQKHRQRLIAAMKAATSSRPKGSAAPNGRCSTMRPASRRIADPAKTAAPKVKPPAPSPASVPVAEQQPPPKALPAPTATANPAPLPAPAPEPAPAKTAAESEDDRVETEKGASEPTKDTTTATALPETTAMTVNEATTGAEPLLKSEAAPISSAAEETPVNATGSSNPVKLESSVPDKDCIVKAEQATEAAAPVPANPSPALTHTIVEATLNGNENNAVAPTSPSPSSPSHAPTHTKTEETPNGDADKSHAPATKMEAAVNDPVTNSVVPVAPAPPQPMQEDGNNDAQRPAIATLADEKSGEAKPAAERPGLPDSGEVAIKKEEDQERTQSSSSGKDESPKPLEDSNGSESQFESDKNPINGTMISRSSSGALKIAC